MRVCFCMSILSMSSRLAWAFKEKKKKTLTPTHPKPGGGDVGGVDIKDFLPFIKDYFQQDLKSWSSTPKAPFSKQTLLPFVFEKKKIVKTKKKVF